MHASATTTTARVAPRRSPAVSAPLPAARGSVVVLYDADSGELLGAPVADPQAGIWYLILRATKVDLDHLDASGSVSSIQLPKDFAGGSANDNPGLGEHEPTLAVDRNGTVWVLGRRSLAEVRPGASAATFIPFGPLPDNHGTDRSAPDARDSLVQQVLVSNGAGRVAFALTATPIVREYDANTGRFIDVHLPAGSHAESLRFFGDGSLAIGIDNVVNGDRTHARIARPDGTLTAPIEITNAAVLNPYSDTAVLAGAFPGRTVLRRDGTTSEMRLPVEGPAPIGGVQRGRNGTIVVPTQAGITVLAGASDPAIRTTLPYATAWCAPIGGGPYPTGGRAVRQSSACAIVPADVVVGSDGAIWQLIVQYVDVTRLMVERTARY